MPCKRGNSSTTKTLVTASMIGKVEQHGHGFEGNKQYPSKQKRLLPCHILQNRIGSAGCHKLRHQRIGLTAF